MAARGAAAMVAARTFASGVARGRLAVLVGAYVALTAVFVAIGFPYQRIEPRVAAAVGAATGAQVGIGKLDFALRWLRPWLIANDLDLAWGEGLHLRIPHVRIAPALSLSWLRGEPSVALSVGGDFGEISGTARIGRTPAFRGDVHGLALDKLPSDALAPGLRLTGALDASLDLRAGSDGGAEGSAKLDARNGSITPPNLPVGLPFAKLDADLALGGGAMLTVKSLALEGPLVAGSGTGSIGRGRSIDTAPLALELHLQARDPGLRQLLTAQGLPIGPDGTANLQISGTLASPALRPGAGGFGAPVGARPEGGAGARPPGASAPRPAGAPAAGVLPPGAARALRAPN